MPVPMTEILGQSPQIAHLIRTIPMIALSDASVLIEGETGTGKELVAQAIHAHSHRRDQPLITINCAALPIHDAEVDLFGACDADGEVVQAGRLLAAEGATVFLDEVDALPPSIQAKVLRFLEAGECQLQGSHRLHTVNVRIIAASSANLPEEVKAGRFRADLYYRLQVLLVSLPPLRERTEDIEILLRHYLKAFSGKNAVVRVSTAALNCLQQYDWPGNVRELMNLCQRYAILQPGIQLMPADLPVDMQPDYAKKKHEFKLPASGIDLAEVELDLIEQALEMAAGNRSKAARLLGISRDTLLYRMQKYDLTK
ncbi:sigma-54-dependent transcriptional regulator [Methylophaga lonarensis MPL]|uniref:Sigma-54-dependent transcriptional regulator n=2 Tax=Methylophaga lonarensis TaxID=999151 RepID=M7P3A1_9GAMM|nr:sigma-54-dependent transcriptional regulator [Methylophaga lonarensis MPL]